MIRSLTVWVTPFTGLTSLGQAIEKAKELASSVGAVPNLLLPANFGAWPQAQCRQNLPPDMRLKSPDDVASVRAIVEAAIVGFGLWSVPVARVDSRQSDVNIPTLCAKFAEAAGYWIGNWEPAEFWIENDDPAVMDDWWTQFWNALDDPDAMSGNVAATVIPNSWGMSAYKNSLVNLAAGCGALALEVYGGLQTAQEYPSLWPKEGFLTVRATGIDANLIPILALANLQSEIKQAYRLGHGNVHLWCI
jgi:hypothetical protein